jgi:hypothetical protein
VKPNVIPPHRPDKNPYVERFHRTLSQECLRVHLPRIHPQVNEVTEAFLSHYNDERPNQARSCGNRPPQVACPDFPSLPAVSEMVDPDRWLERVHQQAFARSVQADGGVTINHEKYYLGRELAGQRVTCLVNAREQQFDVWHHVARVKQLPIKGALWQASAIRGVCLAHEARSALRISALSAGAPDTPPRPPVGLIPLLSSWERSME